eukprot:scaffold80944_cov46-Prasinocladus_malaysianus.AAC.1
MSDSGSYERLMPLPRQTDSSRDSSSQVGCTRTRTGKTAEAEVAEMAGESSIERSNCNGIIPGQIDSGNCCGGGSLELDRSASRLAGRGACSTRFLRAAKEAQSGNAAPRTANSTDHQNLQERDEASFASPVTFLDVVRGKRRQSLIGKAISALTVPLRNPNVAANKVRGTSSLNLYEYEDRSTPLANCRRAIKFRLDQCIIRQP